MLLQVFIIAVIVSFMGSIPPGTLNVLVLQLGLEKKLNAAFRFAIAVAIIEYPYALIAVEFEGWITKSPLVQENFKLLAAIVMTALGILGLWSARKPSTFAIKLQESGFRRGLILSILNPQAIPWWIGMTAYLKAQGWIALDTTWRLHGYVLGTAIGALALLSLVAILAHRLSKFILHDKVIKMIPGTILFVLGIFAFTQYFFS